MPMVSPISANEEAPSGAVPSTAIGSVEIATNIGPSALVSVPDARCVAGCYRCLLSYFNQPDHELIDRRQQQALQVLLRMACTEAHNPQEKTEVYPDLGGCPPPDAE